MTNPRKVVDFTGLDRHVTTFPIDGVTITYSSTAAKGSAVAGRAVELSANRTVALVNDGNSVLGQLELVEADGMASVIDRGYVQLPGGDGGPPLTVGQKIVGDLNGGNRGYIRALAAAGGAYAQGFTQELANARHQIIDSSVATAVWVKLD